MAYDYLRRAARGDILVEDDESSKEDDDTKPDDEDEPGSDQYPVGLTLVHWCT